MLKCLVKNSTSNFISIKMKSEINHVKIWKQSMKFIGTPPPKSFKKAKVLGFTLQFFSNPASPGPKKILSRLFCTISVPSWPYDTEPKLVFRFRYQSTMYLYLINFFQVQSTVQAKLWKKFQVQAFSTFLRSGTSYFIVFWCYFRRKFL